MVPRLSPNRPRSAESAHDAGGPPIGASLLPCDVWSRLRHSLKLSARELQIVQGIFEDQKQESIAFALGISPHSVNTYMQRIYAKLRIGSRPQLIVRVMSEYLASVAGPGQTEVSGMSYGEIEEAGD
jgi:DNA-binding CsgD family transcriptional regulator